VRLTNPDSDDSDQAILDTSNEGWTTGQQSSSDVSTGTDLDTWIIPGGLTESQRILVGRATYTPIYITNSNGSYAAHINTRQLRGFPVLAFPPSKYKVEDADSIALYGRRTWKVQSPYIQSYVHAQMIGDFLLERFKDPVQQIRIVGARGIPYLEVGDRVTVVADSVDSAHNEYYIGRLNWSYGAGENYRMDMECVRAYDLFPYTDYFVVGKSKWGSGTGHGHLFW